MIDTLAYTILLIMLAAAIWRVYGALFTGTRAYDTITGGAMLAASAGAMHCVQFGTALGALLWFVAGLLFVQAWQRMEASRSGWRAVDARVEVAA